MKLYFTIILILLIPFISRSTCIVILRTPTEIIIGADSRRIIYAIDNNTGLVTELESGNYCKIFKESGIYFSIAGFDDQRSLEYAKLSCKKYQDLKQVALDFAENMKNNLEKNGSLLKSKNLTRFKSVYENKYISSISFFRIKNNAPEIITIHFVYNDSSKNKVSVNYLTKVNEPITFLGSRDHIDAMGDKEIQSLLNKKNNVLLIKTLINLEIKHHPNKVGAPINVLRLSAKKEEWIYRDKTCY